MSFKLSLSLIFLIIVTSLSMAQKPPMKFGKIDIENLKMTHYEKDSSASAVVLCDYGKASLEYSQTYGFQVFYDHHIRIKILNEKGYKWANAEERLYNKNKSKERLINLKGITYNLENGKVEKTKLKSTSSFKEKFNKNYDLYKLAMPKVKKGSIIEYSYTIVSDFTFNFQSWEFQKSIPVLWSEFRATIPEYFNYQKSIQGYLTFLINTQKDQERTIALTIKESRVGARTSPTESANTQRNLTYYEHMSRYVVENSPAFVEEPYLSSVKNYISKIRYGLATYSFPNQPIENVMGTWKKLNKQFLKSDYFGKRVSNSNFLKKEVESIINENLSESAKTEAIYNYVKQNFTWDGRNRIWLDYDLINPFEAKKGSSSEINLILTSMLQKAGVKADPVLISTRKNGIVREKIPISSQFNHVICKVQIEGEYLLIDATDAYLPINILPSKCLNGNGWVVSSTNPGWVKLASSKKSVNQISGTMTLSENGMLSGKLVQKYIGYESRSPRKKYLKIGEEKYVSEIIEESSWDIDSISLENANDLTSPFIENYVVGEIEAADVLGGKIYFTPMIKEAWTKNPLKLEKREYPVDFGYYWGEKYYVTFTVPEGYEVEEIPAPLAIGLPNSGGKFVYNVSVTGNKITVLNTINVKQTMFSQSEYAYIKEFFAQIVSKHKEQIILKKI